MGINLEKTESSAARHVMGEEIAESLRAGLDLFTPAGRGSSPSPENPDPNRTKGPGDNKPTPKSGPEYLEGSMQGPAEDTKGQGDPAPERTNKPGLQKSAESSESIELTNPYL